MIGTLRRKVRQLADDPVLRRWLAGRLLRRFPGEPAFTAHRPPYLAGRLPLAAEVPRGHWPESRTDRPSGPLVLSLPGKRLKVAPGQEGALLTTRFDDTETLLGLHRFAWLPLAGEAVDPAWVSALWQAWAASFGKPNDDWPWHPYTAAERAINILAFARRHGLPGQRDRTLDLLAAHGPAIAARLEYFGDHHTGNHLSNNGRGLYLLGLELGMEACRELGAAILIEEARRIFRPSGVLREESSHYHLLLTRNYIECWLAARAHGRPEARELEPIVRRALSVMPYLALPGGMPLIGDISPDCPPTFLAGLLPGNPSTAGWTGLLAPEARQTVAALRDAIPPAKAGNLAQDGWLRADFGPWAGLWHAAPDGWSHMPGHGHQDLGGFELHYETERIFVDPGRGAYGEQGEAAHYRSGHVHNTLLVDGADPYPANKPYYGDAFRRAVGGPAPLLNWLEDGVSLVHHGYARLPEVGQVERTWRFVQRRLELIDRVGGEGSHRVSRLFHTPLPVEPRTGGAQIIGQRGRYRLHTSGEVALRQVTLWQAYGEGRPGTAIEVTNRASFPFLGTVTLEAGS